MIVLKILAFLVLLVITNFLAGVVIGMVRTTYLIVKGICIARKMEKNNISLRREENK